MKRRSRRIWLLIGTIVLALGIASLFVPIPRQEEHGFAIGPVELGVKAEVSKPVEPVVSAVIIVIGVAGIAIGARR